MQNALSSRNVKPLSPFNAFIDNNNYSALCIGRGKPNINLCLCFAQDELRALIEAQAANFALELQQVRTTIDAQNRDIDTLEQTIDAQNQTIVALQQTVDDKCETIEQQQMTLEQVNATLQMFIETQEISNIEQNDFIAFAFGQFARIPRKCVSNVALRFCLQHLHVWAPAARGCEGGAPPRI